MSVGPHSRKKVCYYYDAKIGDFNYDEDHPMQPKRINMTHGLVMEYGLRQEMIILRPPRAQISEMSKFHDMDYVNFLKDVNLTKLTEKEMSMMDDYNLGEVDCPVFEGLYDFCQISAGGSVAGAKKLNSGEADIAINWAGGLHHAHKSQASGFCFVNDIVLAIMELLKHYQRVLYLDIDIHHGDGVEEAFKESDRVMTVSFHFYKKNYLKIRKGKFKPFFPGTGKVSDIGDDAGKYYAVNVPLNEGITDSAYESVFVPIMTKVMESYQPSAIVLQCGADSLTGDRLGHFNMTLKGHGKCVEFMRKQNLPLLLLGGGGYTVENVARCWTYETGLAVGRELEDELPYSDYFPQGFSEQPFKLHINSDGEMVNMNSLEDLQNITAAVLENLRQLPCAPGVPLREMEDTFSVMSTDAEEEDEDLDQRNFTRALDKRLAKNNEFSDSEDEDESGRRDEDDTAKRFDKVPDPAMKMPSVSLPSALSEISLAKSISSDMGTVEVATGTTSDSESESIIAGFSKKRKKQNVFHEDEESSQSEEEGQDEEESQDDEKESSSSEQENFQDWNTSSEESSDHEASTIFVSKTKKASYYTKRSGKFHCKRCDKTLGSSCGIISHYERDHLNKRYKCDNCDTVFKNLQHLQRHKNNETCKKSERKRLEKENDPEYKFICEKCGKRFKQKHGLTTHLFYVHSKVRYPCDICKKSFKTPYDLKKHHNLVHLHLRYVCEFCQKSLEPATYCKHKRLRSCQKRKKI